MTLSGSGLSDPGLYSYFFGQNLDFAVSPRKSRHPLAIGRVLTPKPGRICERTCVDALNPKWRHCPLADQLGVIFAELFRKVGG